jgi:hypothetical protein
MQARLGRLLLLLQWLQRLQQQSSCRFGAPHIAADDPAGAAADAITADTISAAAVAATSPLLWLQSVPPATAAGSSSSSI